MRRVVVTGLGIVSSIGTGQEEVTTSLRETKSGVKTAPDHITHGFRSQVWAPPALGVTTEDWAPLVDRRAARFLANGTAWGHIAFEEALKDSGMTPTRSSPSGSA
jgi:3-oxoacyl-[acyl-carrier-protein] synthase-1